VTTQMESTPIDFVRGDATGRVLAAARARSCSSGSGGMTPACCSAGCWTGAMPTEAIGEGPRDPVFLESDTARNQLHISQVFLNLWQTHDLGASLDRLLARQR